MCWCGWEAAPGLGLEGGTGKFGTGAGRWEVILGEGNCLSQCTGAGTHRASLQHQVSLTAQGRRCV